MIWNINVQSESTIEDLDFNIKWRKIRSGGDLAHRLLAYDIHKQTKVYTVCLKHCRGKVKTGVDTATPSAIHPKP